MKTKRTDILLLTVICIFGLSCERKIDWQPKNNDAQMVVDALLTNEQNIQSVFLYYTHNQLNEDIQYISDALITLKSSEGEYLFTEEAPGRYTCPPIPIPADSLFQLTVLVNGIADTASAKMGATTKLSHLSVSKASSTDSLYYCSLDSLYIAALTEINYDWSTNPYYTNFYGSPYAKEYRYKLNNIDVASLFPADKNSILFPHGTKIIRRQYGLSEDYAEYLRSMLMETNWRGGIFDMEHANALTNFKQGTLGWFAISEVISDTTITE
jgi:hypothetical protein